MSLHRIDFNRPPISPSEVAKRNLALTEQARKWKRRRTFTLLGIFGILFSAVALFYAGEHLILYVLGTACLFLSVFLFARYPKINFDLIEAMQQARQYETLPYTSFEMQRFRKLAKDNPRLLEYLRLIQRSGRLPTIGEYEAAVLEFPDSEGFRGHAIPDNLVQFPEPELPKASQPGF